MYGTIYFLDGRVAACWPNGERITSFHHLRLICIDSLTHDAERRDDVFTIIGLKLNEKLIFKILPTHHLHLRNIWDAETLTYK